MSETFAFLPIPMPIPMLNGFRAPSSVQASQTRIYKTVYELCMTVYEVCMKRGGESSLMLHHDSMVAWNQKKMPESVRQLCQECLCKISECDVW